MRGRVARGALVLIAGAAVAAPLATAGKGSGAPKVHGYASVLTAHFDGGTRISGTVTARSKRRIDGKSVKERCRADRRVEVTNGKGLEAITRTSAKGNWSVDLPVVPGQHFKVFTLAKQMPENAFCDYSQIDLAIP